MLSTPFADQLRQAGFELMGSLDYRLSITIWWNPQKRIQVLILCVGRIVLIKGDKSYYLKSVSADGETWVRDLPALHDYLESHFPSVRLSFSHFRDVPPSLAEAEVKRRSEIESPTLPLPTVEQIAQLQPDCWLNSGTLSQVRRWWPCRAEPATCCPVICGSNRAANKTR